MHGNFSQVEEDHDVFLHIAGRVYSMKSRDETSRNLVAAFGLMAETEDQTTVTHYGSEVKAPARNLVSYVLTSGPPGAPHHEMVKCQLNDATLTRTLFSAAFLMGATFDNAKMAECSVRSAQLGLTAGNASVQENNIGPTNTLQWTAFNPSAWHTDGTCTCPDDRFGPCGTLDRLQPDGAVTPFPPPGNSNNLPGDIPD